ncbi:type III-B CRISPR-associated protein Cas10/Cmr2 [Halorhodospira halochloris]|uniref:type III-B CRISPR-associated protein Cas10/Cmr2 n=1 Tax=Halorhodospira halochloris TaxID=1052 RepID=UPI001EE7AC8E|nr:type III-B CRISPR-associated protein Cas10/Cmr2 [Halorhodospira halochloris]MCG5531160.1 type III-B CRISPR-associated protein Cas10/Cmr2 [Halorhodospira halochloris]
MPRMLITLSLGPVQSLIEAARRTRDLWCGSWLLSEVSRAAAHELHRAHPKCLIFPSPENPGIDLKPLERPADEANIANILRAEVELPDGEAARHLCEQAKLAARERLIEMGDAARGRLSIDLRDEVWNAQLGELLELFAAWVEIPPGEEGYRRASEQLGATLAARKATRDFTPAVPLSTSGLPKSSLDGAFETVLFKPEEWPAEHYRDRRKLGLSRGEHLDALGVTKRLAGKVDQFTAYSRIAADPWIQDLGSTYPSVLDALNSAYEPLVKCELATRVTGNQGCYEAMPYDAQLLYTFRLEAALGSSQGQELDEDGRAALADLQKVRQSVPKEAGDPVPYGAILKADGDRMGKLLQCACSADQSRRISRELHKFASQVRHLVREHRGHAIYSGGDDVLALVPLPNAVRCADSLARTFAQIMQPLAREFKVAEDELPTLSAGICIGHIVEPLGSLRARAGVAEHRAKGDGTDSPRNALAVVLGIRSGGELTWRKSWDDREAFSALEHFIDYYRADLLPSRVAYDIRAIDQRFKALHRLDQGERVAKMSTAEVSRTLDRARTPKDGKALCAEVRDLILERTRVEPLAELAESLILARWLAARNAADLGERGQ